MAQTLTKRSDVVATFHRHVGRNPTSDQDWKTVEYLMTKPPQEVEKRLSERVQGAKTSATEARTSNIDPVKVAQKLGYTANDFANDPNFISHWSNKSQAELEEALKGRGDYDKTLGRKMTPSEMSARDEETGWLDGLLEDGTIDQTWYNALDHFMKNTDVNRVPTGEEFEKRATEALEKARVELDPYYKDVQKRDMEDVRNSYADIRNQSLRHQQQEAKSYAETLANTKQSLRARGLTFSGSSRATLGKEGALNDANVEGTLPQQRRYNYEDFMAGVQQNARDLGTSVERKYGSDLLYNQRDYLNPEGLPDPYAGGIDYKTGNTRSIYLPKKEGQDGHVSGTQADIERQKEEAAQHRANARLSTLRHY